MLKAHFAIVRSSVFEGEAPMSVDSGDATSVDSIDGVPVRVDSPISLCSVSVPRGTSSVTLWCGLDLEADTSPQCRLRLAPDRPAIIGRAEGHPIWYLDPTYQATRLVPGTGQNVLRSGGNGQDMFVSRGHFMLRAASRGVLLVNGVPRPDGGLRAPLNGTRMVVPERRPMSAGEEFLIESGATAVVILPNGSEVEINAD
jgi:hypothetical protein